MKFVGLFSITVLLGFAPEWAFAESPSIRGSAVDSTDHPEGSGVESRKTESLESEGAALMIHDTRSNKDHRGRALQDDPSPCGSLDIPCTYGAVCAPNENMNGEDWCLCDVSSGFINKTGSTAVSETVELYGLHGYLSACTHANECINQGGTTNVCGSTSGGGGGCENRRPEDGQYRCFCQAGYLPAAGFIGEHGPEACVNLNECSVFPDICGEQKTCTDTPGSFRCTCNDGLVETQYGDCLDPLVVQDLPSCDTTEDCSSPKQQCDETLLKCVCRPGYNHGVVGASEQEECQQTNECHAQLDQECDRRGRGGPYPRSECIDISPSVDDSQETSRGYACACRAGFQDGFNTSLPPGTNCIESFPTTPTSSRGNFRFNAGVAVGNKFVGEDFSIFCDSGAGCG